MKKLEVRISHLKKIILLFYELFISEPILANDEIHRAQSLDELHTRLAAIRGIT